MPLLKFLYESLTIPAEVTSVKALLNQQPTLEAKLADCHIYVILICLLILTEDLEFNKRLHTIVLISFSPQFSSP